MAQKKILISGYYGFDNFGDDAILHVLISDIKKNIPDPDITVISNNPDKIRKNYGVDSIYRFDLKTITSRMKNTDLFISGGGSLLQDITSLQSLIYYLSLLFLAQLFKVKTYIYAQGIGPIQNPIGKILTRLVLRNIRYITVRDINSQNFLKKLGIISTLTSDPVWNIEYDNSESQDKQKIKVGVELREWKTLNNNLLKELASAINSNFKDENYQILLISLQDSNDLEITQNFKTILESINPELNIELKHNLSVSDSIKLIGELDYLIAMRFHACLVSIRFNIPTLALSYDPKVETLSKDAQIPFIQTDKINQNELNQKIQDLIENKNNYIDKLKVFSSKKQLESRQNADLLGKILVD